MKVIFQLKGKDQLLNKKVNEGVNELFQIISEHPGQRVPFLSKKIQIPQKTIERWIRILKDKGKIEFKGKSKTGGYYIKFQN